MSQVVAFEYDRQGVRAAVVDEADARLTKLARIDLPDIDSGEALAAALREALPDVRWARATVVAVLGGDQLRCRLLKLPPCPDGELPDLVRMQAVREFALTDDAVVDFVPLSSEASAPRQVLAATVDADVLKTCAAAAERLDAVLARAVARAAATAALAVSVEPSLSQGAHLIAAASVGAVDLVVLESGEPTLLRSARAPEDAASHTAISEARRTAAMAAQQSGNRVSSTWLIGYSAEGRAGLQTLDASAYLQSQHGLEAEADLNADELVGVAAAAIGVAKQAAPSLDFLHPRRPVVDNSIRRRRLMLAVAAAATVLLGVAWDYSRVWSLKQDIASKKLLLKEEEKSVEQWAPIRAQAAAVDEWLATDVNWLDELERLGRQFRPAPLSTEDFPAETDAYLTQFTATRSTQRDQTGGRIDLRAVSRSPYSYDELEQRLRDATHHVETTQGSLGPAGSEYRWETQTSLRVDKPTEGDEQ